RLASVCGFVERVEQRSSAAGGEGLSSLTVRPELVEGRCGACFFTVSTLRQAQGERLRRTAVLRPTPHARARARCHRPCAPATPQSPLPRPDGPPGYFPVPPPDCATSARGRCGVSASRPDAD